MGGIMGDPNLENGQASDKTREQQGRSEKGETTEADLGSVQSVVSRELELLFSLLLQEAGP